MSAGRHALRDPGRQGHAGPQRHLQAEFITLLPCRAIGLEARLKQLGFLLEDANRIDTSEDLLFCNLSGRPDRSVGGAAA